MMAIADIYAHFGLAEASKPHCFSLENIAELLIPEQSEDTATIIHILPLAQQITVSQIEALIKAFEKRDRVHHSARIFASQNMQGNLCFHILSPNERNETEAALDLLSLFIEHMSALHV